MEEKERWARADNAKHARQDFCSNRRRAKRPAVDRKEAAADQYKDLSPSLAPAIVGIDVPQFASPSGPIAQSGSELPAHNRLVPGSNPGGPTCYVIQQAPPASGRQEDAGAAAACGRLQFANVMEEEIARRAWPAD